MKRTFYESFVNIHSKENIKHTNIYDFESLTLYRVQNLYKILNNIDIAISSKYNILEFIYETITDEINIFCKYDDLMYIYHRDLQRHIDLGWKKGIFYLNILNKHMSYNTLMV